MVPSDTGVNDMLNGYERPVEFEVKETHKNLQIIQSLAKWKRIALKKYGFRQGTGLYTDMNAIRRDEETDNIHSIYVDQWDWEMHIDEKQRNLDFLKSTVKKIYTVLKNTEYVVYEMFPQIKPQLPDEIFFISAEELLKLYPTLTPKERENEIAKKYKAVFIMGIGAKLANGEKHDGRAPDYDDWSTPNCEGFLGLNGDIVVWNNVINRAFELSSMGVRVNKESLLKQLEIEGKQDRKQLYFHSRLLNGTLPQSIGGGIGQSRLCMFFLRKAHIGEIQSSLWSNEMREECKKHNIALI